MGVLFLAFQFYLSVAKMYNPSNLSATLRNYREPYQKYSKKGQEDN